MGEIMELTVEECLSLLPTKVTGRIAFGSPAGLRILPVNYALFDDKVVFRTLPYGEIAANVHGADCALEIDEIDEEHRRGWSVLAVGTVRRVEDHRDVRMIKAEWNPEPFASGLRTLYFRLDWRSLTGRQIGIAERPSLIPVPRSRPSG
jgi:uncharacterized protein